MTIFANNWKTPFLYIVMVGVFGYFGGIYQFTSEQNWLAVGIWCALNLFFASFVSKEKFVWGWYGQQVVIEKSSSKVKYWFFIIFVSVSYNSIFLLLAL